MRNFSLLDVRYTSNIQYDFEMIFKYMHWIGQMFNYLDAQDEGT